MKTRLLFATGVCVVALLIPSIVTLAQTTNERPLQQLFQTETVYSKDKGEIPITFASRFTKSAEEDLLETPLAIEYGIIAGWKVRLEWAAANRLTMAAGKTRGSGHLRLGARQSWMNLRHSHFNAAVGFDPGQGAPEKKIQTAALQPAIEVLPEPPDEEPQPTPESKPKRALSFTYSGEITNYFISESHAFFGNSSKHWLETSLRFDTALRYKNFTAGVSGLAIKTTGQDAFGTGTIPAGVPPGIGAPGASPNFYLDRAYLQLDRIAGLPLKATLGRQYITIGTQFLIGDGVYDGFSAKTRQGVYHSPRKGFDALRVEWDVKKTHFDSFIYRVDPTWDGGGGRDGLFGGVDISRTFATTKGTYAAGIFYRSSRSRADNNMAVFNVRAEQPLQLVEGLYVSGELVLEFAGSCRNAFYCTTIGQKMQERAGHIEIGYEAKLRTLKPFAEAGYVYYSKDFTPIATGFSDWGKWYLGNQIDWIIFGTNTRIIRAQAGFWPVSTVKLRAQFHNTQQAVNTGTNTGGSLSNEVSIIGEWFPRDNLWFNVVVGESVPGKALGPSGLANSFSFLNAGAATVGTRKSFDVVFATSWRF